MQQINLKTSEKRDVQRRPRFLHPSDLEKRYVYFIQTSIHVIYLQYFRGVNLGQLLSVKIMRKKSLQSAKKILTICKKNPYNLQKKSLQIVNSIAKHNFGIGSHCNTPLYNKQTKHNLLCHRSFTFVLTKHSWCHCKLTTVRI